MHKDQKGSHHIVIVLFIFIVLAVGAIGYRVYKKNSPQKSTKSTPALKTKNGVTYDTKASEMLTHSNCSGEGATSIGPPMKVDQIGFIQPYGLMVGGHVTPVDHQYYNGLNTNAPRDT